MEKKYTTALFDVDGTIVTLDGVVKALQETLAKFELRAMSAQDIVHRFMGRLIKDELPKIYPHIANEVDEIVDYYTDTFVKKHRRFEDLQPYVKEIFHELKNKGIRIGIVTTKGRQEALAVLRDYELPYDTLISHNEVHAIKPSAEPLKMAMNELGSKPDSTIMVGDHVFDMMSAKSADCDGAGVLTGASTRQELLDAGALYIMANLSKLPGVMGLE